MKRIIAALVAALVGHAAAAPAAAADRIYTVVDFDRIEVEGPYRVTLATGVSTGARATGSQQALEQVSVEVRGRTLRIRPNRDAWGGFPGDSVAPAEVAIRTRNLRSATVTGSADLEIDRVEGLRVDLSVSGSGSLAVGEAKADRLVVGLLGSGRIAIAGEAKKLVATIQGSGDLDAAGLRAEDVELTADTAGAVAVEAGRAAKVTALGPGDVTILGAPSCTLSGPAEGLVRCGRGAIR